MKLERRTPEIESPARVRFLPTFSWDSLITILLTAGAVVIYVNTMKGDQERQGDKIEALVKSVQEVRAEMKERTERVEIVQKERADRLEKALDEQRKLLQETLAARLRR
jgi:ABC-type nitrate/sulfonate/bicarbonate transport system substrate-binding protein